MRMLLGLSIVVSTISMAYAFDPNPYEQTYSQQETDYRMRDLEDRQRQLEYQLRQTEMERDLNDIHHSFHPTR